MVEAGFAGFFWKEVGSCELCSFEIGQSLAGLTRGLRISCRQMKEIFRIKKYPLPSLGNL